MDDFASIPIEEQEEAVAAWCSRYGVASREQLTAAIDKGLVIRRVFGLLVVKGYIAHDGLRWVPVNAGSLG
jgi:hypothetical protein